MNNLAIVQIFGIENCTSSRNSRRQDKRIPKRELHFYAYVYCLLYQSWSYLHDRHIKRIIMNYLLYYTFILL